MTCTHCGLNTEREGLDALAGGFGFKCGGCKADSILVPESPTPEPLQGVPEPSPAPITAESLAKCPKCHHTRGVAQEACHRCGLIFAYLESGRAQLEDPLNARPEGEALQAQWALLAQRLDDTEGHHAFIERCAHLKLLEYAGQCYRDLASLEPVEDPRVADYRARVLKTAMAYVGTLERHTQPPSNARALVILLVAALILLGFALGYYLLVRMQNHQQWNG